MDDDDAPLNWEPSDSWVAGLARTWLGIPHDKPVHPEMIRVWRRELLREMEERDERPKTKPPARSRRQTRTRDAADITATEIVIEMLASPQGQAAVRLCLAMPRLIAAVHARARIRRVEQVGFRPSMRDVTDPVLAYLRYKVKGGPEGVRPRAAYVAAVNAVTPARARAWEESLATGSDIACKITLEEMDSIGREAAVAAAPLVVWYPEPGPPRGLWPDPPPPDELPAEPAASGAIPPYIPSGR